MYKYTASELSNSYRAAYRTRQIADFLCLQKTPRLAIVTNMVGRDGKYNTLRGNTHRCLCTVTNLLTTFNRVVNLLVIKQRRSS